MSKRVVSRMLGMFQSRTQVGVDKADNRYFTRVEEVDGVIEWICWLNGQTKKAPTPEDIKACCGSRLIAILNSSSDNRSASFPYKELQMTTCALQAMSTKTNCTIVVTFMVG